MLIQRRILLAGLALSLLRGISEAGTLVVNPQYPDYPPPNPPTSSDTGNDIVLTPIPIPTPPPPPLPSIDPSRPLSGNHLGSAGHRAVFRVTINSAGRYTLFAQGGGQTVRRRGQASDKPFVMRFAGGHSLTGILRLETEPVPRPRLAVQLGDGPMEEVTLYSRRELAGLPGGRFHLLLDGVEAPNAERDETAPARGRSFAVLLKQGGGLLSLAGKDPAGRPWSCWTFTRGDWVMPVVAQRLGGWLLHDADGLLVGGLGWFSPSGTVWSIRVEGSPFVPPPLGENFFGDTGTAVTIAFDDTAAASVSGTCDSRGSIVTLGGTPTRARLKANQKSGLLSGSMRFHSAQPAKAARGLYIPHLDRFVGQAGGESFEVSPQ